MITAIVTLCTLCIYVPSVYFFVETEYWEENDMDYFQTYYLCSQETPPQPKEFNNDKLTLEEEATVWWIVLFTDVFQTLACKSDGMEWLLKFLVFVIVFLGKFANPTKWIASHLPN